jgi:hypothetical protein
MDCACCGAEMLPDKELEKTDNLQMQTMWIKLYQIKGYQVDVK